MLNDDLTLLREYARTNSEAAFSALVERHVNLVYSVALRSVREPHLAGEITQAVFILLARKADKLGDKTILPGWLCRTARYASANALTIQRRRQHREQEAHMQSILNEAEPMHEETWNQIAPLLDSAMEKLGQKDHDALVLWFFENKTFAEVGVTLGASEDAAKMRVNRALEKLRKFFTKRGVSSTTAIIAGTISANSVQAAPVALAKSVTAVAIVKGSIATTSTLTLVKGALNIMAWAKAKITILIGTTVILAAGAAALSWQEIQSPNDTSEILQTTSPQVKIVPTQFAKKNPWGTGGDKLIGFNQPINMIIAMAYDLRSPYRIVFQTKLPEGHFDFIANLPSGSQEALQRELKSKFGVEIKRETRETDVLLLKVKEPDIINSKRTQLKTNKSGAGRGRFFSTDQTLFGLAFYIEYYLEVPVIDRTELTNHFDIDLKWPESDKKINPKDLKQALLDQLGLELIPTNMSIDVLVVEKARRPVTQP